jgi:predicted ABC-type ATPase
VTSELFDRRPIVVAVAGPNGAGKSTFYDTHLRMSGLRFVNADELARELNLEPYTAAGIADVVRRNLVAAGESFVFETVLSDPEGAKVTFLRELSEAGYVVVLCFIGLADVEISDQRVALRVAQGGHDVPRAKLEARFGRSLKNLERALAQLPFVHVYDNSAFGRPHKLIAQVHQQQIVFADESALSWFQPYMERLSGR